MSSRFDAAAFEELRRERGLALGWPLVAVAETGSTNDDAMAAAHSGAPAGAVFVADAQTRGRGRRGNVWSSPPGENLTFSLVLRPTIAAERASQLTLIAGAALRAAVSTRVDAPVRVKWPNDLVVGRRKLAGILLESKLTGRRVDAVVLGIGVNVHMTALPEPIAEVATSLALLGATTMTREALLADVLGELETRLDAFDRIGLRACLDELRAHDALLGERVTVEGLSGTAAGLDPDGGLLVRDAAGQVHVVTSGHVTWE